MSMNTNFCYQSNIPLDRKIDKIQPPYRNDLTPYDYTNEFDETVRSYANTFKLNKQTELRTSKIIILGDVSVGKTSLVNRFVHNSFNKDYKATIGVDFEVERFSILNVPFNLQIWDTAGQERFKCIAAAYYRGANAIVVTFDLTNIDSLLHTEHWLNDALSVCSTNKKPYIFLVGTKNDLYNDLTDTKIKENIQELAFKISKRNNSEYWSVSSLNGDNVKEFFFRLSCLLFNKSISDELKSEKTTNKKQIGANEFISLNNKDQDVRNNNENKNNQNCC